MALNFPENRKEVEERAKTDVQNELPESNPFLKNSYLGALITAYAGRVYDFYLQLEVLIQELFPDTATAEFLERWGSYVGILRNPATQSIGQVTVIGNVSTVIPAGTQLSSPDSIIYETLSARTIQSQIVNIDQLTRTGSTAFAKTSSEHLYYSGMSVTITGAAQAEYNGTFNINVISSTEFSYNISGTPLSPASGTITSSAIFASLSVRSLTFGEQTNQNANTRLNFVTPIAGANNQAFVQAAGLQNGTDIEPDNDLRERILFRYQNPVALFNKIAIELQAKLISGVTRVFIDSSGTLVRTLDVLSIERGDSSPFDQIVVLETDGEHFLEDGQIISVSGADQDEYNITTKIKVLDPEKVIYIVEGSPTSPATGTIQVQTAIPAGQVQIYFTRDNDANIIPSSIEVQTVKDKILEIKPAHVRDEDVIVKAPMAVNVDFVFSSVTPNITGIREAIQANLDAFFKENTEVSVDVRRVAYESVIYNTIDPVTGERVIDFDLSSPTSDIIIQNGQLAILNTVTFS